MPRISLTRQTKQSSAPSSVFQGELFGFQSFSPRLMTDLVSLPSELETTTGQMRSTERFPIIVGSLMLRILYHIFQVRKQREGRRTESAIFLERSVDPLCSSPFLPLTIYQVKASWDTNILLTKFGFKVPVLTQLLTALDRKTQSAPILLVHLTMILQSEPFFRFSVNKAAQKQA